jgi:hypothetical protein
MQLKNVMRAKYISASIIITLRLIAFVKERKLKMPSSTNSNLQDDPRWNAVFSAKCGCTVFGSSTVGGVANWTHGADYIYYCSTHGPTKLLEIVILEDA